MATTRTRYPNAVTADMTELNKLIKDMKLIRSRLKPAMRKATADSAKTIQMNARKNIRAQTRGKYTKYYPQSITYTIGVANASLVKAEIGPDKALTGKQGALGNILEFGTVNNAPIPHLIPAYNAEINNYADKIGLRVADAVW